MIDIIMTIFFNAMFALFTKMTFLQLLFNKMLFSKYLIPPKYEILTNACDNND